MPTKEQLLADLVSPTGDIERGNRNLSRGLSDLAGARIMLLDNTKSNSGVLFDELERYLTACGATVSRAIKETAGKPAPATILAEIRSVDAVVTGVGDCGSCSSWSVHDFLTAESLGIPSVVVVSTWFQQLATLEVDAAGIADNLSRIVTVPHPFGNLPAPEIQAMADDFAKRVAVGLTSNAA